MTSLNGKDHTFHGRPEKECSAKPKNPAHGPKKSMVSLDSPKEGSPGSWSWSNTKADLISGRLRQKLHEERPTVEEPG